MPQAKKQRRNKEVMERISITIPKKLLAAIDIHVKIFAEGELADNRAKYICSVLEKTTPTDDP